jgi:hypothetical protein
MKPSLVSGRPLVALLLAGCTPAADPNVPPNFGVVDEGHLVRGGQPTTIAAWRYAASFLPVGRRHWRVKLDYNDEGPADDGGSAAAGFTILYLPMQPADDRGIGGEIVGIFTAPDPENDARIFRAILEHWDDGVYVGCVHGQDRTGYEIARWRYLHDGWPAEDARLEATRYGFHWDLPALGWALAGLGG